MTQKKKAGAHEKKTVARASAKKEKAHEPRSRGSRGGKTALIIFLVILLLAASGLCGGFLIGRSDTILPNMTLRGIDIGGMTVGQAEKALTDGGFEESSAAVTVKLPAGYSFELSSEEAGADLDSAEAAKAAYAYGHTGNPVNDLIAFFECLFGTFDSGELLASANADTLRAEIDDAVRELNELLSAGYAVDEEKETLTVIKGADKVSVDTDVLYAQIIDAFENGRSTVEYEYSFEGDAEYDFGKLRDEIFTEAVSSAYDREKGAATESVTGIDFDPAEAARLYAEAKIGDAVIIPLTVTKPDYTEDELNKLLFRDKLGTQTTDYSTSSKNRATNVELAASKVNGVILLPGEEFSYNDVVGKRTEAVGFKPAGAYSGGREVTEVGGGICQVSSTIYCAALYSNLKITDRSNHHFSVGYVKAGLDATVSWGGPEFKFVNNRDLPIKLVVYYSNRQLTVEIWGTDVDGTYVEMTSSTGSRTDGTYAYTYRHVYDKNGKELSCEKEDYSFYYYHTQASEEPETTPTPSPSPEVTPEPSPSPEVTPSPEPSESPEESELIDGSV